METRFTSGPWVVGPLDDKCDATLVQSADGGEYPWQICSCFGYADTAGDHGEANAALIAAAPELYEALERCEQMVSTDAGPPDWDWVRATLAKARVEAI